jgi:hypothetical protein
MVENLTTFHPWLTSIPFISSKKLLLDEYLLLTIFLSWIISVDNDIESDKKASDGSLNDQSKTRDEKLSKFNSLEIFLKRINWPSFKYWNHNSDNFLI